MKTSYETLRDELNRERCQEIGRLQSQVTEMKKTKLTLQRKAQDESARFREWKQSRLREISDEKVARELFAAERLSERRLAPRP